MLRIALAGVCVAAIVVTGAGCPKTQAEGLIAAALERALVDAKDLPDIRMVSTGPDLIVKREISGTSIEVTPGALPTIPDRKVILLSNSQIVERARNLGEVYYVVIHGLDVQGTEATLQLGVGVNVAPERAVNPMCCCSGEFRYALENGAWVYRGSGGTVCP
ncbi:MAG TPA: hypothetical protein VFB67_06765 [Candidatus Polarisedimenticolaceae bacterium]|nr:hypothetical protein [Candidatus Polarisedimenticolaceae bacterium]